MEENIKNILIRLLTGEDLTIVKGSEAYLNKYKSNCIEIPFNYANELILLNFVEEDSGNWETFEVHFNVYTNNFNRMNRLKELKKIVENTQFQKPLDLIVLNAERKYKLKKIREISGYYKSS